MKKALVMLSSCLLVLLLAAASTSAQSAQGFSILSRDQTLWTFGDPSSLDMFLHDVVYLSLGGGTPVSAAAGDNGGFVVATSDGVAYRDESGWSAFGLTGHRLSDVAFVPHSANNTVVAFGVANGIVYNNPYFTRAHNGVWDEGVTVGQTEATGSGSIAFSGNLGFAAIGGLILRSTDGGASWTSSYSGFTTFTKVAVFDSSLIVATGPGTVSRISLMSVNGGNSWEPFSLPTFNPTGSLVTGITFLNATKWVVTTSGGEIWHTDGQVWNRTFAATNISWVDVAFLPHWGGVLLAAGSVPLSTRTGVFALSWDQGLTWSLSPAQPDASFVRVVAALPQPPAPSPSPSPSPSASPSVSPTRSPSASATPSAGSSPSASPSASPSTSVTPSPSPTPSRTASPSVSPSASTTPSSSPSASVTPSVSSTPSVTPSKGSSPSPSPTSSVTPSTSPSPSGSPSFGSSPSPSASPAKKKDDGSNKKLALGLGLGLGLGGLVALIGGAAVFWYFKQRGARRNVYQAINTNDV